MYLKKRFKNNQVYLYLAEKIKDGPNRIKERICTDLGSFSKSLRLGSDSCLRLIRKIIKISYDKGKSEFLKTKMSDSGLVDFLNGQMDLNGPLIKNASLLLLDKVLERFGLKRQFEFYQSQTKRGYSLYDYFKFTTMHCIVRPGSLLSYYHGQDSYELPFTDGPIKCQDLYDFLTFYYSKRHEVQKLLFETTIKIIGPQRVHVFFYDGTNFTFCVTKADPDHFDRVDGVVRKGLRQFGYSKNKRFDRVCVGMGIIATDLEIPLFFTVFPGSDQEITHIKEDIDKLLTSLADLDIHSKSIVTADAGNYSGDVIFRLAGPNNIPEDGDGYIIGRSVSQLDKKAREWATDPAGYYPVSRRKRHRHKGQRIRKGCTMVKSRVVYKPATVKLENGRTLETQVRQKQIAIFSTKRKHKALRTIKRKVEKVADLASSPVKIKNAIKDKTLDFLEVFGMVANTGEMTKKFRAILDDEKIQEEIDKAGFFVLTTSEIDWPSGKVLHCYREKNKIEHLIRTLKKVLRATPAYVYKYDHIVSHFELCAVSLVFLNFIREMTRRCTGQLLSPERIQKALEEFQVAFLRKDVFIIPPLNKDLNLILETFDVNLGSNSVVHAGLEKMF